MRFLKTVLFHILYTFRGLALRIIGFTALAAFLVTFASLLGYAGQKESYWLWLSGGSLVAGLVFRALAWYYDALVLKLAPDNVRLTLYS